MSGKYITDRQIRLYMTLRETSLQEVAAAKAGISVSSAGRIDNGRHQLKQTKTRRRTRVDPLIPIWDSVVLPLLKEDPEITPIGIFDHLCESHSDKFSSSSRRTLERRIKQWRHLHGANKDVVFMQEHPLGKLGICDFTHVKSPVTINLRPFKHMLFNYRLVSSGWVYTQVTYGGESFAAFSDGLQNAFAKSKGVPREVRTDSLSAAYKNSGAAEDFTARYQELIAHYGFIATRNNTGVAHENGAIESPNRHIKAQLEQALKIRGSYDFNCRADYEAFVQTTINRRNKRIANKFKEEQRQLQSLPSHKSVNYSQEYVRVSRTSTINVKRVMYTVPSRLVDSRLRIHIYDDHIDLFVGCELTYRLERIYAPGATRKRSVNYKHVIDALVKKPRAFRCSQWRDELLPNEDYRTIWAYVDATMRADDASHYMVRVLHLAGKADNEMRLGRFITGQLRQGRLPSLFDCQERFDIKPKDIPNIDVMQHELSQYQSLIPGGRHG
ncbi:IS21 family transposase [Glaciecola sp. SC05]|uniref:IS21 family transposase n=1 Tax=Glaciecola sp. SC05 TaxID=1987355 RepID=UPI00352720F3